MRKIKFISFQILISFFLMLATSILYINDISFFESINKRVTDLFLITGKQHKADENIVIVDIDEKSLEKLGQWPWSREVLSQILVNLANSDVGVVGFDVVFAEPDSSSPKQILQKFGFTHPDAQDNDEIFAYILANTPTITGYVFDFKESILKGVIPNIPAIFVEKNKNNYEFLPKAKGLISNYKVLQENSFSSGFFNTVPDTDGIVRSIPMLATYDGIIYPALSLEIIRAMQGSKKVVVNYSDIGITSIEFGQIKVPTDRFGRMSINYAGRAKSYKYLSAVDIYNGNFNKINIENKIVLIGSSAAGILDLRATPMDSTYPGVEIHANAIDNILNHNFIHHPSWVEAADIIFIIASLLLVLLLFIFLGAIKTAVFFSAGIGGLIFYSYKLFVEDGIVLNIIYPLSASVLLYMILTSLHYIFESRQRELIKDKFSKKVSSAVVEELIKSNTNSLKAKEEEITIFFSDIRGFTTISESLGNPQSLISLLNTYMTPMVEIIVKHKGTVDKFIGDAIMAYWNAPVKVNNHADEALEASIEQIITLKNLNLQLEEENQPIIEIGIGLNSGACIVGEMGSFGRSDYTCIGDPVNLASRTEGLCKTYGAKIILTEFTKKLLKKNYSLIQIDVVRVKGKDKPVKIYECFGSEEIQWKNYNIPLFNDAFSLYQSSQFDEALEVFLQLQEKCENKLYSLYIERCEYFIANPPFNFNGVFTYDTK